MAEEMDTEGPKRGLSKTEKRPKPIFFSLPFPDVEECECPKSELLQTFSRLPRPFYDPKMPKQPRLVNKKVQILDVQFKIRV